MVARSGFPERASVGAERDARLTESATLLPEGIALHKASIALETGGAARVAVRVARNAESARLGVGSAAILTKPIADLKEMHSALAERFNNEREQLPESQESGTINIQYV